MKYNASQLNEKEANNIVIHPFFNMPINVNPLKEEERKYPIDMVYPNSKIYKNEITIPDNCIVKNLPEKYLFNSDLFFLQYVVSESKGKINVSASYQFKKSVYEHKDYAKIQNYFNLIIKHFNQKIVLTEK